MKIPREIIERVWTALLAVRGATPHGWPWPAADPPTGSPPSGKNWIRFDFKPGTTPEEIARVLNESLAKHSR